MTWNPEVFQGWGRSKNYFEGWYIKLVTARKDRAIAVIPGISYGKTASHAFVQVMDGTNADSTYHRFETSAFQPSSHAFELRIGENSFSSKGIGINLGGLHGEIHFTDHICWPRTFLRPGIMGWYSFVPFMQCYHGLVSMNHTLTGILEVDGKSIDFTGGKGYIEKDWGSSFPKSWIWTQCNHFEEKREVSVMASVAHIPWLGSSFIGFLALIWTGNAIKIFTTYSGAEMQAMLQEDQVTLGFRDKTDQLVIKAKMAPGVDLVSPIVGEMVGKINESLQATQEVTFTQNGQKVIQTRGTTAGLEISEGHEMLLTEHWRK